LCKSCPPCLPFLLTGHGKFLAALPVALACADEELARRAELERRLVELSDKEYDLMLELGKLRDVEL
jgi:hypothetical protein